MTDSNAETPVTPEQIAGARGNLGSQVELMEREFARLAASGDEIPPLAAEMLSRLRALATALDGLEAAFEKAPPVPPPAEPDE